MFDPLRFRKVLSAYPTGVCVITAGDEFGMPHAMVVGSFTAISLAPPLAGFFPAATSQSWIRMQGVRRFCVNILASRQLDDCIRFAAQCGNKFDGIAHAESPSGQPLLGNSVAWLDCAVHSIFEVGDHFLVVGQVDALGQGDVGEPLVFHDGSYRGVGDSIAYSVPS